MTATPEEVRTEALALLEESVPWIEMLTPAHFHEFIAAFARSIGEAMASGDKELITELLEKWVRTAEVDGMARIPGSLERQ